MPIIFINPDVLKQVQTRLSTTAKSLLQQSAVPIITIGIDPENRLIVIADEALTTDNMIAFLQQIIHGFESKQPAIVIPSETFLKKV